MLVIRIHQMAIRSNSYCVIAPALYLWGLEQGASAIRLGTEVRSDIGHGLTTHAGEVGGDPRGCLHEEVAQSPGDLDIAGLQRDAHPLLGVVVVVDRVVAPVGAVVVPDIVVWIEVFIFHAPISAEGVGHPLSEGSKNFQCPRRGAGEWCARRESNPQPSASEADTLSG